MVRNIIKYIFRIISCLLLTVVAFMCVVAITLYLPPVQRWAQKKFCEYAKTEMKITLTMDRLSLAFPFDLQLQGVMAYHPAPCEQDTLFSAENMRLDIGFSDLFSGRLRADAVELDGMHIDTRDFIKGYLISGDLGRLRLKAKCFDMITGFALVNDAFVRDAHFRISIADTTKTKKDTTEGFLHKLQLLQVRFQNVSVAMALPLDSMRFAASLDTVLLRNVVADLHHKRYKIEKASLISAYSELVLTNKAPLKDSLRVSMGQMRMDLEKAHFMLNSKDFKIAHLALSSGLMSYDAMAGKAKKGLDVNHLKLANVQLLLDSLHSAKGIYQIRLRNLSLKERCGFNVTSLKGFVASKGDVITSVLALRTPYSKIDLKGSVATTSLDLIHSAPSKAQLTAELAKEDLLSLAGDLPPEFQKTLPGQPIRLVAEIESANAKYRLRSLKAVFPSVLSLDATGEYAYKNNNLKLDFDTKLDNVSTLLGLAGVYEDSTLQIPRGMAFSGKVRTIDNQYELSSLLKEGTGFVSLEAKYNLRAQRYLLNMQLDSIHLNHFFPLSTLGAVAGNVKLEGKGTDFLASKTWLEMQTKIDYLNYDKTTLTGLTAEAHLKGQIAQFKIDCVSPILDMNSTGYAELSKKKPIIGHLSADVWYADLKALGVVKENMKDPFSLSINAQAEPKNTLLELQTGDLQLSLETKDHYTKLADESMRFLKVAMRQIEEKRPDQQELRKELPVARILFNTGEKNVLHHKIEELLGVKVHEIALAMDAAPETGLKGQGHLYGLKMNQMELDTLQLTAVQEEDGMKLDTRLVNGPKNSFYSFSAMLETKVRNDGGSMKLKLFDTMGNCGAEVGLNCNVRNDRITFNLFPEMPIIAFRKMTLNQDNFIDVMKNGRINANLQLKEAENGTEISLLSMDTLATNQQDLTLGLKRIKMGDVVRSMPFLPDIEGLFGGNFHFVVRGGKSHIIVKANLDKGKYNAMPLGNIGITAGYTPDSTFTSHSIGARITRNGERIFSFGGTYVPRDNSLTKSVVKLSGFPLELVDGFIPDQVARMKGKIKGELRASGKLDALSVNGFVQLDSASTSIPMANMMLRYDTARVVITGNQAYFKNYKVYSAGDSPFTITGSCDLRDIENPLLDLKLNADDYALINSSKRTHQTQLYGKLIVDMNTTIKGPVDALKMRGNIRVLGTTDLTYIMKDSPLTVEDRLAQQVSFTDFADTLANNTFTSGLFKPSSMDVRVNLTIDNSVHVKAQLTEDGSSFVDLTGGGKLILKGNPEDELGLTGKYTVSSGSLKYAFPMIPLKEFTIKKGSLVQWTGKIMNPTLDITATETMRCSVSEDNSNSRMVNFDISVILTQTLEKLGVAFDISAPEDATMQTKLTALTAEERSKQAITTLATGMYQLGGTSGVTVGDALNSLLQQQINSLAGNLLTNTDVSIGMNSYSNTSNGVETKSTDYTYKFAKRIWNNRIRIIIGGTISSDKNDGTNSESFINNISLEYMLDKAGTRSVRLYHNKNYESVLEGEIVETGVGFIYRKKFNRWSDLLPWKTNNFPFAPALKTNANPPIQVPDTVESTAHDFKILPNDFKKDPQQIKKDLQQLKK